MLIVTSIVATGAGLRVAASFIERKAHITALIAVLAVAVPIAVSLASLHALYYYLVRTFRPLDLSLLLASGGIAIASAIAAWSGIGIAACLVILVLAPSSRTKRLDTGTFPSDRISTSQPFISQRSSHDSIRPWLLRRHRSSSRDFTTFGSLPWPDTTQTLSPARPHDRAGQHQRTHHQQD
jgi:hypothetical protein